MGILGDLASGLGEIGRMYRTERREEKNLTEEQRRGLNNLIQRAESGDVEAMTSLADLYYEGTLLRYDPNAACHWWTEAAKIGDVVSMYNLGILYMGDVSKQFYDDKQAVYWLTEASKRGYQDAWDALNENYKWSNLFQKWSRR